MLINTVWNCTYKSTAARRWDAGLGEDLGSLPFGTERRLMAMRRSIGSRSAE